ncbi:hypothetical protein PR002_g31779 [Phytophthora rubi]|uniref:Uncharacterized protein n=1 Tax=Phytophthora rubi TaxID=129364 RepID=A0A6A3GAK9_9STRA|nr:hypothetical protein PR002_g31779 [Phytophthora rubi]
MGTTASSKLGPAQAQPTLQRRQQYHRHHRPRAWGRRHRASWGRHKRGGTTRSSGSTTANGSNMPAGVKRGLRPEAVEAAAPPPPEASSQRRKW